MTTVLATCRYFESIWYPYVAPGVFNLAQPSGWELLTLWGQYGDRGSWDLLQVNCSDDFTNLPQFSVVLLFQIYCLRMPPVVRGGTGTVLVVVVKPIGLSHTHKVCFSYPSMTTLVGTCRYFESICPSCVAPGGFNLAQPSGWELLTLWGQYGDRGSWNLLQVNCSDDFTNLPQFSVVLLFQIYCLRMPPVVR